MKCVQFHPSYTEIYFKMDIRKVHLHLPTFILYNFFILIHTYYMYVHNTLLSNILYEKVFSFI